MHRTAHDRVVIELAIAIADDVARADIESFALAKFHEEDGGWWSYSTTETVKPRAVPGFAADPMHDPLRDLADVQRAARYIRVRGNNFPWRMVDVDGEPGYVRFIDKEGRPVDPGALA